MSNAHQLQMTNSLAAIDPAAWNALSRGQACLSHAFMSSLEATACVDGDSGWKSRHLTLWNQGRLAAAMPMYEKRHSFGEYVFDWAWAEAYARNGLSYYPKLVCAIPFSPIPGPRLLGEDIASRKALIGGALDQAKATGVSSLHILFPNAEEGDWLSEAGLLIRQGVQFHWENPGYRDFTDFLDSLNNNKRKKIRQERRRADLHGLDYRWLDGTSANEADWAFFYQCYATTYALHRSSPYLTPEFFTTLAARAPHSVRLLQAERNGSPIASAFFLCDEHALYGRYWGATEYLPFLHFELCYYRAIEFAIAEGLSRFEGGAQGEHKLARGLQPVVTRSAHWIRDPRFRDAVDDYLTRETEGIAFYLDELADRTPFRRQANALPRK
jgi:predicted N-acyltransferase